MPLYELEIDGRRFQVDAPSMEAAVNAARQMAGGASQQGAPSPQGLNLNRQLSQADIMSAPSLAADAAQRFNTNQLPGDVHEVPPPPPEPTGVRDPQFARGGINAMLQGGLFNLGDEAAWLFGGLRSLFDPDSWSEGAGATRDRFNADLQYAQEQSPQATFMASLVGGLPWMAAGGGWAMAPASMAGKIARGAFTGGAGGALYGYGSGEGGPFSEDRLESALESIPLPALLGGAAAPLGVAAGALANRVARQVRKLTGRADEIIPPAPTIDELKTQASAFYRELREQGITAPPETVGRSYSRLVDSLHENGVADDLGIVAQVDRMFQGKKFGFDDLERIRRRAQRGMVANDGEERFAAGLIFDEVTDLIEDTMGDMPAAARSAWSRAMKAETLQGMIYRAEVRSESGATSFEQALRTQVSQMLTRKHGLRGFTEEEVTLLRAFNKGTPWDSIQRSLARFDPRRSIVAAAFSGVGLAGGAPEMAMAGLAGALSRGNLDRMSRGRMNRISEAVRRDVAPHKEPPSTLGWLLPPAAQGGASVYGGQNLPRLNLIGPNGVFGPSNLFTGLTQAR